MFGIMYIIIMNFAKILQEKTKLVIYLNLFTNLYIGNFRRSRNVGCNSGQELYNKERGMKCKNMDNIGNCCLTIGHISCTCRSRNERITALRKAELAATVPPGGAANSAMPKLPSSTEVWKMVVDLCADKKLFCEVEAARAISEAVYKFIYRQLRQ